MGRMPAPTRRRILLFFALMLTAFCALYLFGGKGPPKPGDVLWRQSAGKWTPNIGAADGVVYYPTYNFVRIAGHYIGFLASYRLTAREARTGKRIWRVAAKEPGGWAPAVSKGSVCVSTGYSLYAVDAKTGGFKWDAPRDVSSSFMAPSGTGGDIIVPMGVFLEALDAKTGTQKWLFNGGSMIVSWAVSGGFAFVTTWNKEMFAVDIATGKEKWTKGAGAARVTGAADGMALCTGQDGALVALDGATGAEAWRFDTQGLAKTPIAAGGDAVYVATRSVLHAIDARTGKERWATNTVDEALCAPCIGDGVVYVATRGNALVAVDTSRGAEKWRANLPRAPASGLVFSDGVIVFATADGYVYAVKADEQEPR